MALHSNDYPSIIKLKQLEKEMQIYIDEYKDLNSKLYSEMGSDITRGAKRYETERDIYDAEIFVSMDWFAPLYLFLNPFSRVAKEDGEKFGVDTSESQSRIAGIRMTMDRKIDQLKALVKQAEPILADIVSKGALNQDIVSFKQKDLNKLSNNLNEEGRKIKELENEILKIEEENKLSTYQQNSSVLQGWVISLLAILVIGFTINTLVNPKGNSIETAILIIAVAIVLYFLYNKYV